MTCELNDDSCEDCTLDYCQTDIDEYMKEWYDIHSSIAYYDQKIEKLEYEKKKWLDNHAILLR